MTSASTSQSGFDPDLSITNPIEPPPWIARFSLLTSYWFNPVVQSRMSRNNWTLQARILPNPRELWFSAFYIAFFIFIPFLLTCFSLIQESDIDASSAADAGLFLIAIPLFVGYGICGVTLVLSLFLLPKRFDQRLDTQKPDPLITSSMSDSEIFYGECIGPNVNAMGFFAALPVSIIITFLAMLLLSIILWLAGIPSLALILQAFDGLIDLAIVMVCIVTGTFLLAVYCVLTVGSYSSALTSYWATLASVLDIGIFVLLARWIAISIVRINYPRFNDSLFSLLEGTPGRALPLYTLLLLILISLGVIFTAHQGVRAFKAARQGSRG
jgi:hypothetical protein